MKHLIATLILSTLSLTAMADETSRPELDLASLHQKIREQQLQASRDLVSEAISNLRPLALDTLVVEASPAVATHPES
ncbi:hypothetical protein [Aeromonas bivalvium]|uniref:hypothetical protein n=1 Tax=Aeromonas bivalvium TaxID=440079 RepID=UPI000DD030FB|nr:hypothetical protein [Aeromonas bivalvium]